MKTLQIGMGWFPDQAGGLNRFYRGLMESLPGADVETVGLINGSESLTAQLPSNVHTYARTDASAYTRLSSARRAILQQLDTGNFDVLASHFAFYTIPAIERLRDIPMVVHFQGPWAMESRAEQASLINTKAKQLVERMVYRQARRFIVLSKSFRDLLVKEYNVDPNLVRVIPGGIDCKAMDSLLSKTDARHKLGLRLDVPTVVTVRRLAHRMGLENLIDAIGQVRRAVPDMQLLIAGKGALAPALQRRIHENKLEQHVRLLGFVADDDLPALYRAADINVVPSVSLEGFGLTAAEALAAGTPSMVTPVGGLPEVVGDLSQSLILESSEVKALAEGLTYALTGKYQMPDPEKCRAYSRANFDWSTIAAKVAGVYRESVNQ